MPKLPRPPPPRLPPPLRLPPPPPPKPSEASASASCCEANCSMSCAAWRSTSAALCPRSLQQGLHFGGSPDDLRGRDLVWRRAEALRAPGDPQRPVQPVLAAPQGVPGSALREALASCCGSRRASGDDRLRRLDARLPQPASERRGPRRVQTVMPPSSESGRKEGLVNSLGGRGKGTPS